VLLNSACYLLELPVEPVLPPEPTVPLELEPMPVLEDGVDGEVVELGLDGLVVLEDGLVLDPVLEPCVRRQSVFAVPVSESQLELELAPEVLLGLEVELLELGLELEPDALLGLVVELLEPAVLLGLLELPLPALPELWATDTVARPASAAATARPSTFFIMMGLLGS
jgi:hypothetical protein